MTMALTQMQWRIVVESVWVTAQAARQFISRLMKKVMVSVTAIIQKKNDPNIRNHIITKL